MKRPLILCLCLLICLLACAPETHYVTTVQPPPKKVIVLPEKIEDPTLKPYMVNGVRYYPLPDSEGFSQSGRASWYGEKFHGRRTSSGEIFDMHRESAAHKTLPFDTYVKVLNLSNNKQIVVRINDRGPFMKGRIIDLSYAAAKKIGLVGPGVADVKIVALGKKVGELKTPGGIKPVVEISDLDRGVFTVQVGAFKDKINALGLAERLKVLFGHVEVTVYDDKERGTLHRVRVSKSSTLTKAGEVEKRLKEMGFDEAFIVSL
jgi:rare lipoprotein A